jgi:hypothetical protein
VPETPTWGLPYPEASTLITDSAAIVQTLAEKIDAALSQVTASDSYTVPGTLVQDFTASGTFTPPPGVTVVSVVVVGGGGTGGNESGGQFYTASITFPGYGGTGGGVRVYRNVPVSGPVAVTIGGANTPSSFGALSAPGGATPSPANTIPQSPNLMASQGGHGNYPTSGHPGSAGPGQAGYAGVVVNGTTYAGGGGGGAGGQNAPAAGAGGAGGGGRGSTGSGAVAGTNGLGGGGGGAWGGSGAVGGSGRVMIYTEQAYKTTRNVPAPVDPEIDAALNVAGVIVALVAVDPADPQTPGIPDATLVAYPDTPQPTGRMLTVPVDPADPDGPTHEIPELAWPVAGWTYHDGTWTPPTLGEDTP